MFLVALNQSYIHASNETQFITSPGYPNPYPNDLHRVWNVTARPGFFIRLVFVDFETEKKYDVVNVSETTMLTFTDGNFSEKI